MALHLKKSQSLSDQLTTEQAATLLGVSRRFLDKDRSESRANGTFPKIPYTKHGHPFPIS